MRISMIILMALFFSASCTKGDRSSQESVELASASQEITVYKNPNCGCCTKWVDHMRENGFKLVEKPVNNLSEIKDSFGVPKDKRSCHTAVVGGYVFEGHIPAESIKKFLKAKSKDVGLVVPDMPMGSPGMEFGKHKDKFEVYSFDKSGQTKVFENY